MKKYFTFTELLVMVAIMLTILSVLLPSLDKVSRHSKQVQCSARNFGSISYAISEYIEDYDSYLPGAASGPSPWIRLPLEDWENDELRYQKKSLQHFLLPYLTSVFVDGRWFMKTMSCPETQSLNMSIDIFRRHSYSLARNLEHTEMVSVLNESNLQRGNDALVESTQPFGRITVGTRLGYAPMRIHQLLPSQDVGLYDGFHMNKERGIQWTPPHPVHIGESINIMYLDGHVEVYAPNLVDLLENHDGNMQNKL